MTDVTARRPVSPTGGGVGRVRVLGRDDLPAALRLLAARPVENVFVASRIRAAGLEPASLGCPVWGYERDGELRSLCHAGSNLVPVNADPDALAAWTEFAGPSGCAPRSSGRRPWRSTSGGSWGSAGARRGARCATSARTSR